MLRQLNIAFMFFFLYGLSSFAFETTNPFYIFLAVIGSIFLGLNILVLAIEDVKAWDKEYDDLHQENLKRNAELELKQSEMLEQIKLMNEQLDESIKEINERNAKKANN